MASVDRLQLLRVHTVMDLTVGAQPYPQAFVAGARTLGVADAALPQVVDACGDAGIESIAIVAHGGRRHHSPS